MNEAAAREIVLVRAVEQTDAGRVVWTDEDRAWASRAAAEVVGSDATAETFVARRASLAIERLAERYRSLGTLLRATTWRPWIGPVVVGLAFLAGLAVDRIGPAQRISILAFPLLLLLAWNVAVYLLILLRGTWGLAAASGRALGPVARFVGGLARGTPSVGRAAREAPIAAAATAFATDWARVSARLTAARVGRVLHLAAFALALGAIAGLYVRGLVLEYRAGWESTFLDADIVHRVLALALGPASALTGIPIPDAAHLEAIRFGAGGAGENAAPWIHLYAVTVALVVLLPRALLALGTWLASRRLAARFPLALDDAYFLRLARQVSGGPARVHVVPYGYQVSPQATLGAQGLMARVFGATTQLTMAQSVAWGGEDALPGDLVPDQPIALAVALFNLSATPEPENQGAFLAALVAKLGQATPLIALLDESGFRRRFAQQPARLEERRGAWRSMLDAQGVAPVFVDLEEPDLAAAERELNAAIERRLAAGTAR